MNMLFSTILLLFLPLFSHSGTGDVRVYKGTSSYTSDILATIRDGKVHSGTSPYTSDILFTVDGNLTIEEFVAVWHAAMYVY